jgi:hypothetical protein
MRLQSKKEELFWVLLTFAPLRLWLNNNQLTNVDCLSSVKNLTQ